jgi:hypothetical protein
MRTLLAAILLLSSFAVMAEDHSEAQFKFYLGELMKAGGKSKHLGLTRCKVKELELSIGEDKVLLQTANASFHERSFQTNMRCDLNKVEVVLNGTFLVVTKGKRSTLKDVTFEHLGERTDFTYLVSEFGYFSIEDQLRGYRSPSP